MVQSTNDDHMGQGRTQRQLQSGNTTFVAITFAVGMFILALVFIFAGFFHK